MTELRGKMTHCNTVTKASETLKAELEAKMKECFDKVAYEGIETVAYEYVVAVAYANVVAVDYEDVVASATSKCCLWRTSIIIVAVVYEDVFECTVM